MFRVRVWWVNSTEGGRGDSTFGELREPCQTHSLARVKHIYNYNHHRPNMALGGITPKQRLAIAA